MTPAWFLALGRLGIGWHRERTFWDPWGRRWTRVAIVVWWRR